MQTTRTTGRHVGGAARAPASQLRVCVPFTQPPTRQRRPTWYCVVYDTRADIYDSTPTCDLHRLPATCLEDACGKEAGRTRKRSEMNDCGSDPGLTKPRPTFWHDLGCRLDSVRDRARQFDTTRAKLHVLINSSAEKQRIIALVHSASLPAQVPSQPDIMPSTILSPTESALLSLTSPPAGSSQLVQDACSALAEPVLASDLAKSILSLSRDPSGQLVVGVNFPAPDQYDQTDLLALAVSFLHAYGQINWTGPALPLDPLSLFDPSQADGVTPAELNAAAIDSLAYCGEPVYHLSKATAFLALALQILGLVRSPFAPAPATAEAGLPAAGPFGPEWALESVKAWRLRAGMVWLKVIDEPVPLPGYVPAQAAALRQALPLASTDRSQLSLSLSLLASLLSRSSPHSTAQKEASLLAREAADEEGLEWELTGRMGKRTKWQQDAKTQLVVLARDRSPPKEADKAVAEAHGAGDEGKEGETKVPEVFNLNDDTLLERTAFSVSGQAAPPTADAVPLSDIDPSAQPNISPFSQAVLLSLSLATLTQATSLVNLADDVLSTSQISAFVARVLLDPQNWSVHSMALLLRCRAEAGRSRTVERGVLQMQALVDQLKDGNATEVSAISSAVKAEDMAPARDRLAQFHALALPPAWELERELATRYLSLGITKSALEIFTRLEMWEEVARCWSSLERPDRGIEVIRDLLSGAAVESETTMLERKAQGNRRFRGGEKREAKLWCILGELENKPEHYEKAWEVSGQTSSRAQRSLGAVYSAAQDWDKARIALRLALKINPLFPRTWFVLGCCEMRLEDWVGAQEAFGRCVALEDDDAQSWSNLASCHLRRGEKEGDVDFDEEMDEVEAGVDSTGVRAAVAKGEDDEGQARERLPFSRKKAAFHCLKQAIKHSYESWRMWFNYMIVAVDVGELSEACRALGRVVEMRATKDGEGAVDLDVLGRLVDAVTRSHQENDEQGEATDLDPNLGRGLAPRVERLITQVIYPKVSSSPGVFKAHARLLLWRGDYAGALDAHLKAYRAGVAADAAVEHDRAKFVDACEEVDELVSMLENLGSKDKADGLGIVAKDWKFQARSLVRTFLGRTKGAFEEEEEYARLKELVQELR